MTDLEKLKAKRDSAFAAALDARDACDAAEAAARDAYNAAIRAALAAQAKEQDA